MSAPSVPGAAVVAGAGGGGAGSDDEPQVHLANLWLGVGLVFSLFMILAAMRSIWRVVVRPRRLLKLLQVHPHTHPYSHLVAGHIELVFEKLNLARHLARAALGKDSPPVLVEALASLLSMVFGIALAVTLLDEMVPHDL